MEIKIARSELGATPKSIKIDQLDKEIETEGQKIYYFDKDNSHKSMMEIIDHFEEKGLSVYFREVRHGLDENDYMYEVHII